MRLLPFHFPFYTMDLQHRKKSIIILLFILEAIIKNKRHQDIQMQRSNNYHLLTVLTTTNIIFSTVFSPSNTRLQRQPRPKTEGFWTDVFPYLVDGEGYNSCRRHFRITLTTFRTIVTRLESHQAFTSDASNATPVWKQIAIVLWRLANGAGIRVLEQTLGVSQGSVSNFTDRFLEALLDLEQGRIAWPQGSRLATVI